MKKSFLIYFFSLVATLTVFNGCASSGYKNFYTQQAPKKYPPTDKVMLFEYSNIDIKSIKKILFDEYLT